MLLAALAAIVYGFLIRTRVMALSPGTEAMQRVGEAIRSGAYAYLQKQVRAMLPLVIVLAVLLALLYTGQYDLRIGIGTALAFLVGVCLSYAAGYIGMGMAVQGNQRTANQALSTYKGALETAFRSGAVAGMMTVGLGLLGATLIFLIYQGDAMKVLVGFGFGGSLAALFMRVGGGIFTKAADVGADLVGKVEQDIPEDDPRNAATIADNVGDNVGDCAGMAADVFESVSGDAGGGDHFGSSRRITVWGIAGAAINLVPIGNSWSRHCCFHLRHRLHEGQGRLDAGPAGADQPGVLDNSHHRGRPVFRCGPRLAWPQGWPDFNRSETQKSQTYAPWYFILATGIGVVLALVIGRLTEYFTGTDKRPVTEVAHAAQTGPATLILTGFSLGLESATWGVLAIVVALFAIVLLFAGNALLAAYGIALAGLGLLTTTGYVLAMDTFGPISDNANGIFEMSGALRSRGRAASIDGHQVVANLDSAGNTTKALTKGFAIATAVIAAVALFRSFMGEAKLAPADISLADTHVFIGLLIGGAAPYLFCSFAINAVSRAAFLLVQEVRRQFREMPGIMAGTQTPDYARCVEISTAAAQRELLGPGILAICLPILVGFGLGAPALGGYLAGAIVSGQLMAVLLANSGGAWDNAKKKVEDGLFGGKGTEEHKAAVIGDTVGDPFKDTAGPALNPLIKVMNLVGVLIAGTVVSHSLPLAVRVVIIIMTLGLLTGAILFSKRGGDTEIVPRQPVSGGTGGHGPVTVQTQKQEQTLRK